MTVVATAPPAANGNRIAGAQKPPLWGEGMDVPFIVGTGPFGSGKSTFGVTICPGPETLAMDNESSLICYRSLGFEHVDMSKELRAAYGEKFTPSDRYVWWRKYTIDKGKTGKYRVLVVDPASELEDGLSEYIRTHVSEFGMTAEQMRKSSGIFWGVMKAEWKKTLDLLRTYFETVYMTVHLRTKYIGNTPTDELEPKGKETLYELASLFLWFEKVDGEACPAAKVEKSRLSKYVMHDGEITPVAVLPPRLPRATPKAIRDYIAKPPDYSKLKKTEKVQERHMSEDQKLALNAQIAVANKETAEIELNRLQLMQEEARRQQERADSLRVAPDQSAAHAAASAAKVAARAQEPIAQATIASIVTLLNELFSELYDKQAFCIPHLQAAGVEKVSQMTQPQGEGLHSALLALRVQRTEADMKARGAELSAANPDNARNTPIVEPSSEPPFVPDNPPTPPAEQAESTPTAPGPRPEQIEEFKQLAAQAFPPELAGAKVPALILKHGAPRAGLLTPAQCDALIAELKTLAAERAAVLAADTPKALATPEQINRLGDYAKRLGWASDKQIAWLAARGIDAIAFRKSNPPPASPFSLCTAADIDARIEEFMQIELGFQQGGMPGN